MRLILLHGFWFVHVSFGSMYLYSFYASYLHSLIAWLAVLSLSLSLSLSLFLSLSLHNQHLLFFCVLSIFA